MKPGIRHLETLLLALACICVAFLPRQAASAVSNDLQIIADIPGSRFPGMPGNLAVQSYVEQRFQASGFSNGVIRFDAPVFRPGETSVALPDGKEIRLQVMHPTMMRPGNFSEREFDAPLVYLGYGRHEDLKRAKGVPLEGSIAVMEFDSGARWVNLYRYGIRGFIFLEPDNYSHFDAKTKLASTEIRLPRFLAPAGVADELRTACKQTPALRIRVKAQPSRWEQGILHNPWVFIPGADPVLGEEVVAMYAAMDAGCIVPERAAGGQYMPNLYLLLGLLDRFRASPPQRSVMLAAVNAHSQFYAGERALAYYLLTPPAGCESRRRDLVGSLMDSPALIRRLYGELNLAPPGLEAPALYAALDVLAKLDELQTEEREQAQSEAAEKHKAKLKKQERVYKQFPAPPDDPLPPINTVLDLAPFTHEDYAMALDEAVAEAPEKSEEHIPAAPGRQESDAYADYAAYLADMKQWPIERLKALLLKAKPTFDDEKKLELWRTHMDWSTGSRIPVKSSLQTTISRDVNRAKMKRLHLNLDKEMPDSEREEALAELDSELARITKLLVMLNKIDIGIGRRRVHYREIALDNTLRTILSDYRDKILVGTERSLRAAGTRQDMEEANQVIHDSYGDRRITFTLALDMNWLGKLVSLNFLVQAHKEINQRFFGLAAASIAEKVCDRRGDGYDPFLDTLTLRDGLPQEHYYPSYQSPSSVMIAGSRGIPGFSLRSPFVAEGRSFTPADTVDRLDVTGVERLAGWTADFLTELLADVEITDLRTMARPTKTPIYRSRIQPLTMDEYNAKSVKPNLTTTNCLFVVYHDSRNVDKPAEFLLRDDVLNCSMALPDANGIAYFFVGASAGSPVIYQPGPDYIDVRYAMDRGRYLTSRKQKAGGSEPVMFPCTEFIIGHPFDPTRISFGPIKITEIWPLGARRLATPPKFGVTGLATRGRVGAHRSYGPTGLYMWRRSKYFKPDPIMFVTQTKRCVLNATDEEPDGEGFSIPSDMPRDTVAQAARDMHTLVSSRVKRMKGVSNELVDDFLAQGRTALDTMEKARTENDHTAYTAAAAHALGYAVKAHEQTLKMTDDMLKAIVTYMALMIPFCFFLQKLLFNSTKLEHELGSFSLLFVGTYVLFRLIHPAFAIASNPEAIFIAFVLGAMGCFITSVLHKRFGAEMQILFRSVTGAEAKVGMSTVGQTAMVIGVNNMKRRRIRTSLTTATIVLVVFTMLAFSSVSKKMRPTVIHQSDRAPYTGIFFHWPGGKPMDEATPWALDDVFGDDATLIIRRTLQKESDLAGENQNWRLLRSDRHDTHAELEAVLGFSRNDIILRKVDPLARGRYFSSDDAHEIILPLSVAGALDIGPDDIGKARLQFLGRDLLLVGLLDDQRYRNMRDLNPNLPFLPRRRKEMTSVSGSLKKLDELEELTVSREGAEPVDVSSVALLPVDLAQELGAGPFSVSIVLDKDDADITAAMGSFLAMTSAKFFVAGTEPFRPDQEAKKDLRAGTYYVGTSYRTSIGGLSRLFIPLLIAGFIILNTMLGTVYERKKEIAVFNAIGLNPTHIFTFFLAEALVYGVIGSVGGYLIGQILAIGLKSMGLARDINVNFSSLMVVYAILFTIGLTLISTIYPGIVATRTAVPSGKRNWSLPDHDGQHMDVTFPFIYRANLALGVIHYLHEYFEGFTEQSIGDMLAMLVRANEGRDASGRPSYSLTYDVALAPFDLGVTQVTTFEARYDDVAESYRMYMTTDRTSGQDTNWVTVNKPLLEKLRKLLIQWRNIDPTKHQWHVEEGKKLFGHGEHEANHG